MNQHVLFILAQAAMNTSSGSRPLTLKRGQIAGEFRVRVVWRQIEKELRCEEIYVRSTSRRLEILNPPWRSAGHCSRSAPLIP